jgi:hypothetical protein
MIQMARVSAPFSVSGWQQFDHVCARALRHILAA